MAIKTAVLPVVTRKKRNEKYGKYFQKYLDFLTCTDHDTIERTSENMLTDFLIEVLPRINFYKQYRGYKLSDFPIIDKKIVISHYNAILNGKPFITKTTSGTTGSPLPVPYNENVYQKEYAFWWYHRSYKGIKRGDRIATIAGHKIVAARRKNPPFWMYNHAENQLFMSSYHISSESIKHYVKKLNEFRPIFLHGFPTSIFLLAREIRRQKLEVKFRPRMIVGASETTHDFQREEIERAFNCKYYIWYGNAEFAGHITECEYGKLHSQNFHSWIRLIKRDGHDAAAGEEGEIVATNFTNTCFPLVNYNTHDIAKLSNVQSCECGRGGKIFDYIVGRDDDYIITPEKRLVTRLGYLVTNIDTVLNAQVEQYSIEKLKIRLVVDGNYTEADEKKILKEARDRLGNTIEIEFDYVDSIDREENGKYRYVKQHMGPTKMWALY